MAAHRTAAATILALLLAGCSPEPEMIDLGPLDISGKADFGGFDFGLPTIDESGSLVLSFSARGSFKLELTQPDVDSSDQASARLRLEDGINSEETASSKTPGIEWEPIATGTVNYTLTIINRSYSRVLRCRLSAEALQTAPAFLPPSDRRTFANLLPFAEGDKVGVAFFDADSTLRISKNGSKTPEGPDDVMLLPGVIQGVAQAAADGHLIAIVSNQGGVHYGYMTFEDAEAALAKTAELLAARGATAHYFDLAPDYDDFRKPATGMGDELAARLADVGAEIDWENSYMVGDAGWKKDVDTEPDGTPGEDFSNSDRGFAEALSIPFTHPRDFFGWSALGVRNFHKPEQVQSFLADNPDFPE